MNKKEKYQNTLNILADINDENGKIDLKKNSNNFLNILHEEFKSFSWLGFYMLNDSKDELLLGEYIGGPATKVILINSGVCGKCAREGISILVPDVSNFEGHIACSLSTRSEICVPIRINKEFIGLLDIDSDKLNNFDETDKKYLERIVNQIGR